MHLRRLLTQVGVTILADGGMDVWGSVSGFRPDSGARPKCHALRGAGWVGSARYTGSI